MRKKKKKKKKKEITYRFIPSLPWFMIWRTHHLYIFPCSPLFQEICCFWTFHHFGLDNIIFKFKDPGAVPSQHARLAHTTTQHSSTHTFKPTHICQWAPPNQGPHSLKKPSPTTGPPHLSPSRNSSNYSVRVSSSRISTTSTFASRTRQSHHRHLIFSPIQLAPLMTLPTKLPRPAADSPPQLHISCSSRSALFPICATTASLVPVRGHHSKNNPLANPPAQIIAASIWNFSAIFWVSS